jgi:hypothetical protein
MFFGEGERWVKGRFSDRRGKCCLVGALDFVAAITRPGAQRPSDIWPMRLPTGGTGSFLAIRTTWTMRGCGRRCAVPRGANGIGRAKRF